MKNKNLVLIFLIVLLVWIFLVSIFLKKNNDSFKEKEKNISSVVNTWVTNTEKTQKVEIKTYSITRLYDSLILKNNLEKNISKDVFEKYLSLFNWTWSELTVIQVFTFWKVEVYPIDEKNILNFFKNNFNQKNIINKYTTNDLVLSSDLNKKYNKNYDEYTFYNEKYNYFFNLKKFYEMNWVCALVFWKLNSFKDFSSEEVKVEYSFTDAFDLLKKWVELHWKENILPEKIYDKALNTKSLDALTNRKLLYTIASKYIETKDNKYIELFYKKFYSNINKDYSYEEYSLFLEFKKIQWVDKSYCDTFNKEFFLWM